MPELIGNLLKVPRLLCLLALTFTSAFAASDTPSVTLAGKKLFLASAEGNGETFLNEYIRSNETFDNWKVLFAVRAVRSAPSVDSVVKRWKSYLAQLNSPGITLQERDGSSQNDRRFSVKIRAPGDSYIECDELRFFPDPKGKGVVYYQAAVRFSPGDTKAEKRAQEIQASFARALESLKVNIVEPLSK